VASGIINANAGYVPDFESSGKLIVDYVRNPSDFAVNKYIQVIKTPHGSGYYLKITPDNAARVLNTDLRDLHWPDGQNAPQGNQNHKDFEFTPFTTSRFAFPYAIGTKGVEQASFDVKAMYAAMAAQQAMTARTQKVATLVTTSGNWPAANTDTATNMGGGKWDVGTATAPYIKASLLAAVDTITQATLGAITAENLVLVVGPGLARLMAKTQEIHTYVKESAPALAVLKGQELSVLNNYGLPPELYGVPVVVDRTYRVTSKPGATLAGSYCYGSTVAVLMARKGGLEGLYGGPSFTTAVCFAYEEMTVETKDDVDNRRILGRVVEDYAVALTAGASGFLFTACSG
jgi:hypothetical protein